MKNKILSPFAPLRELIVTFAFLSSFGASAQMFPPCDDLTLITIGSPHRPDWTKELLEPYVVHEFKDGHKNWFFDGFMMIDGVWIDGDLKYSFGEASYTVAPQEYWEMLPDIQIGTKSGLGCVSLEKIIDDWIPILGKPNYKHQVVLSLPVAHQQLAAWGRIDGQVLNFSKTADRIKASKWFIDMALEKWEKMNFKNIELAGFFYLPEEVFDFQVDVAKGVNDYIHEKGYKSFFIPYFNAPNYSRWEEFGFDLTYIQPNYFFKSTTPIEHLEEAVEMAWDADCGLEMEFEGINYDSYGRPYYPDNCGLWRCGETYYNRFVDYVEKFEEGGAFDFMPLSYYNGYQGVYDFATSKYTKDHEILDRLAANLEKRHIDGGWHEASASVNEIEIDRSANIYAVDGGIYIDDDAASTARIYSLDGRLISAPVAERCRYGNVVSCPTGIYIVKSGDRSIKICVK